MNFIVRILFSGLMAFVPSQDGQEVTVLLLKPGHAYHLSDGSTLQAHNPLLIARAGNCTGQCPTRDATVAQIVYQDKTVEVAQDSLESATTTGGGAWLLDASDLSIAKGSSNDPALPALTLRSGVRGTANGVPLAIPTTSTEREDVSWIAKMSSLCATCTINPAVLGSAPPENLIAARLHLRTGKLFTYSVARIGSDVTPVHFQRLDGTGSVSPYSQAIATWVGADIEVAGDSIEISEDKFDGTAGRTMTLSPDSNGKIEIAVLNLPPFVPPASAANNAPQVGKHFEAYYELMQSPPARETRLVPRAGAAAGVTFPQVDWQTVHPQTAVFSELLSQIRLDIGRSGYDRVLCPPLMP